MVREGKGKNLKDYMVSLGPKFHVYNLPNDFINYVKEQLSNERKKPEPNISRLKPF